jgi:hypothetical protein
LYEFLIDKISQIIDITKSTDINRIIDYDEAIAGMLHRRRYITEWIYNPTGLAKVIYN